jgi:imidazolonepropionase-like amidohydrolase
VEPFVADTQMDYDYGIDYPAAWMLKACLSNGFTTLRDVGGGLRRHRQAVNDWLIPGPRLFIGGPVLSQTGGHGTSISPIALQSLT